MKLPKSAQNLLSHLRSGGVYRREDLKKWSKSLDRNLHQLVDGGYLEKLDSHRGLYYRPKMSKYGKLRASSQNMVRKFLNARDFLLFSPSDYNSLGVGTTQLYMVEWVYNHQCHGSLTLGGRRFEFKRKHRYPKQLTKEFLLVDLLNNLRQLPEDRERVRLMVPRALTQYDAEKLDSMLHRYGTLQTKRFFENLKLSNG